MSHQFVLQNLTRSITMILFDLWRKLDFRGTTGIILWYFHSHWHHCFSLSGLCVTVHAKSQLDRESSFDCLVRTDDRGATVGWALVFSSMVEWFIVCLRNCAACNPSPLPIGDDDDGGLWVIMTLPAVLGIACGTCMFSRCMKYGCRKCNASVTALSVLPSNQQLFHRPLPHLLQATLTPSLFHHQVSFELLRQHNNKHAACGGSHVARFYFAPALAHPTNMDTIPCPPATWDPWRAATNYIWMLKSLYRNVIHQIIIYVHYIQWWRWQLVQKNYVLLVFYVMLTSWLWQLLACTLHIGHEQLELAPIGAESTQVLVTS